MPDLTMVSSRTNPTTPDAILRLDTRRRRERLTDNCFSAITLTLLFSSAIYAVSQLFTLAA